MVVHPAEWLVELWEALWSGQERGVQAGVSQGGGVPGGGTTLVKFWRNDKYIKREKFIPLHSYWVITRGLRRKKKCKWLGKLLGLLPAAKQHYLQETGRDRFPASSPSTENSDSPPVSTGNRKTPQSKETCTKHAFKVHHLKSPGNLKPLPCYCCGKLQQTLPDEPLLFAATRSLIISIFGEITERLGLQCKYIQSQRINHCTWVFISKQVCNYIYTEPRKLWISHTIRERK